MSGRVAELVWRFAAIAGARKAMRQMTDAHEVELIETLPGRAPAVLPSGKRVASVSLNWEVAAVVVDERAFLEWVRRTRPDEVIESVRESYRRYVLEAAVRAGEEPPGVHLRERVLSVTTSFAKGGLAEITRALEAGDVGWDELLNVPEPTDLPPRLPPDSATSPS
ncbi:hypothetical protein [Actinomadura rudentiformis]|uniref:Uncharacterized protein n=1 Tax=Actinomadura rudentiformis TaxID=359158 RepID=A0A6H9YVV2_9ACTN|nr:hypothetical protein [Actinomadura rudentiformis]KAB2344826.1 hypothetical protein F8566_30000 [Actinomadura rudentiformis]